MIIVVSIAYAAWLSVGTANVHPMARHVFVDETKQRDYALVASAHESADVQTLRKLIRSLTLKGQTRIHMKKESDRRRRQIISALCGAAVKADVFEAARTTKSELDALCVPGPDAWRTGSERGDDPCS